MPAAQVLDELGQDGPVARAVDEAGPDDDDRDAVLALVRQGEAFGLDLALGVAVDVRGGQRLRLVGAEVVAGGVDAEAAEVDEAGQRPAPDRLEQAAQPLDVDGAVLLGRPPVADAGGAVEDEIDALARVQRGRVGQFAAQERDAGLLERGGVAAGPDEGADGPPPGEAGFGEVAAGEAGGPGDQTGVGHRARPSRRGGRAGRPRDRVRRRRAMLFSSRIGARTTRGGAAITSASPRG